MDDTQNYISTWAENTFKHNELGIAAHLLSEAVELFLASGGEGDQARAIVQKTLFDVVNDTSGQWPFIPEETADVTILAMTMAGYIGFSLNDEVNKKMQRNVKRVWGQPNEHGFTEHVDPTPTPTA